MNSFKVNDTEMMSAKFQIYSSDTQARKDCLLNYRAMHGNAITEIMYGLVHISANYISQTPFEIYETTNGRNFPVSDSNHFLMPTEGRTPPKETIQEPWVYPQGPRT